MKLAIILTVIFCSLTWTRSESKQKIQNVPNLNIEVNDLKVEIVQKLMTLYEIDTLSDKEVSIVVNLLTDIILTLTRILIIKTGFNSFPLPNATLSLESGGTLTLSNGLLEGIATLARSDDVILTFSKTNGKISLVFPFTFKELKFSFDYHARALFINLQGGLYGSIKDLNFNTELSFSFISMEFALDNLNLNNTGDMDVEFTGNEGFDWLTNAITKVLTETLKPRILEQVETILWTELSEILQKINDAISGIFKSEQNIL